MKHVLTKLLASILLCCTLFLPAFAEKPNYELNGTNMIRSLIWKTASAATAR